jgi:hypothetical protein
MNDFRGDALNEIQPWPNALSFVGLYGLDCGREPRMNGRINGPMLVVSTRRVLTKEIVAFPVPRRSDWSGTNPPPQFGQTFSKTVSTHVAQKVHS